MDGLQTLCFVNVNRLLGFEVGDLVTGQKLYRVEVAGFQQGPTKRHGCPSHGIGLTPDGRELWLTDAFNRRMHIFDATMMPPKQIGEVSLRDEPGWITFSIDGRHAYPSTGDVIDVRTRKIIAGLKDEAGRDIQREKLLEIDFRGAEPVLAGDQFGFGRPDGSARHRRGETEPVITRGGNTPERRRCCPGGLAIDAGRVPVRRQRAPVVAVGRLMRRANASSSALPRRSSRMIVPWGSMR